MATVIGGPWPEHLNSPANTYYQTRPVITMTSSLVTTHWGRVLSVHRAYYPALAWLIQFRAYAMPSVPVPPITLLTDMVPRCRLLTAHGLLSCLSARTQPLTATGAPSQTSTMPYHTSFSSVQFSSVQCCTFRPSTFSSVQFRRSGGARMPARSVCLVTLSLSEFPKLDPDASAARYPS